MKKIISGVCTLMLGLAFTTSCNSNQPAQQQEKDSPVVGNDRDDHGCIGSAGYKWSELLKDCIRPFEQGIKLGTPADSTSTSATYLVFNKDSTRIEAFVPGEAVPPILKKDTTAGEEVWNDEDDRGYTVKRPGGIWTIYQRGKWLYSL